MTAVEGLGRRLISSKTGLVRARDNLGPFVQEVSAPAIPHDSAGSPKMGIYGQGPHPLGYRILIIDYSLCFHTNTLVSRLRSRCPPCHLAILHGKMKFMALLSIGVAAVSALQSPGTHQLASRDLAALTSLLQPVISGLGVLTDTTNSYPTCGAAGLESSIDVMMGTVTTAEQAINYLKPLTMDEALGFKDFAMKMSAAGNGFFTAMEGKLPLFGQDHICGDLVGYITNLGSFPPPSACRRRDRTY